MPKVTVIVPVYGVEKYIERCAVSLFEQTLDDIEYIFIDDCTPDKSIEILKSVVSKYSNRENKVKILHHEHNMGLPQARQTGIRVATGEYIANCDSDDWVDLELYERMYNEAKEHGADIITCDFIYTDRKNQKRYHSKILRKPEECVSLMMHRRMSWSLCNKLFSKHLFNDSIIYPKVGMGEDMCLTLQLFKYAKYVCSIENCFYYYYQNPNSIVQVKSETKCLDKFMELTENIGIIKKVYKGTINPYIIKGLDYLDFYKSEPLTVIAKNEPYRSLWKNNHKGNLMQVISNDMVLFKERVKALLILLGIYPYFIK